MNQGYAGREKAQFTICSVKHKPHFCSRKMKKISFTGKEAGVHPQVSLRLLPTGPLRSTSSLWDVFNIKARASEGAAFISGAEAIHSSKDLSPVSAPAWLCRVIWDLQSLYQALQGQNCSSCVIPRVKSLRNART